MNPRTLAAVLPQRLAGPRVLQPAETSADHGSRGVVVTPSAPHSLRFLRMGIIGTALRLSAQSRILPQS
jgi:hypothetical protein